MISTRSNAIRFHRFQEEPAACRGSSRKWCQRNRQHTTQHITANIHRYQLHTGGRIYRHSSVGRLVLTQQHPHGIKMREASTSESFTLATTRTQQTGEIALVENTNRVKQLIDSKLSDFTINKLKIHSIGFIGRQQETQQLQSCLKKMMMIEENDRNLHGVTNQVPNEATLAVSKIEKELVFIKGFSGVGKTTLARVIRKDVHSIGNGFFAEGKFDLNINRDQPYAGVAKAYSQLIGNYGRPMLTCFSRLVKSCARRLGLRWRH